jgi:hypothetical protein
MSVICSSGVNITQNKVFDKLDDHGLFKHRLLLAYFSFCLDQFFDFVSVELNKTKLTRITQKWTNSPRNFKLPHFKSFEE